MEKTTLTLNFLESRDSGVAEPIATYAREAGTLKLARYALVIPHPEMVRVAASTQHWLIAMQQKAGMIRHS